MINAAATRPFSSRVRRAIAFVAALCAALTLVAVLPSQPRAQAQTQTGAASAAPFEFGDCAFRSGTGEIEKWANQICWIDATGLTRNGSVTKQFGGYTMTFDVTVGNTTDSTLFKLDAKANRTWSDAAFGKLGSGYFERNRNSNVKDVLELQGNSARITLSNIKFTDSEQKPVNGFRLLLADAESTGGYTPGEIISVENQSVNGTVKNLDLPKPAGSNYADACMGMESIKGSGREPQLDRDLWRNVGNLERDFICSVNDGDAPRARFSDWIFGGGSNSSAIRSSFLVAADNPTEGLQIGLGTNHKSNGSQAIALGVNLGRVTFPSQAAAATVDSTFEKSAIGTASTATYEASVRYGTTENKIPFTPSATVPVLRHLENDVASSDAYVFRSKIKESPSEAFKKYDPVWTCSMTTSNGATTPYVIREGGPQHAGFKVKNDRATGSSEVIVDAPDNRRTECAVKWTSRFVGTGLELKKSVVGSAENFGDISTRMFDINYACKDVKGEGVGNVMFSQAYPNIKLTDTVKLRSEQTMTVPNLPKGAQCTVREVPATAVPPSGVSLDLQWNTKSTTSPQSPNNGANDLLVTLGDKNPANANNRYDYRSGTLNVHAEILGEPVKDGFAFPSNEYQVELVCASAQPGGRVEKIKMNRAAEVISGNLLIENVPVAQDCTVSPLTKLPEEQRDQMSLDSRVVSFDGKEIEPDPNNNNAYRFTLPDKQGASGDLNIRTTYAYQKRDIVVHKNIDGPAAGSADLNGASYTVNYKCTAPAPIQKELSGKVELGGDGSEATIEAVPVGSKCNLWESAPSDTPNTTFVRATLKSSDSAGKLTTVDNKDGQTKSVLTVWPSPGEQRNRVVVTNTYDYKLGAVTLNKVVANSSAATVPTDFTIHFACGTRTIAGNPEPLEGQVKVQNGSNVVLKANNASLNDQNGAMGVPYGNSCTFSEDPPQLGEAVLMSTDVANAQFTVSQPNTVRTVTNTFTPAGEGLTITQSFGGTKSLFPKQGITYNLTCQVKGSAPAGTGATAVTDPEKTRKDGQVAEEGEEAAPVEALAVVEPTEFTETFTLKDAGVFQLKAATLPIGSTCTIVEVPTDDLKRVNFENNSYGIDRSTEFASSDPQGAALGDQFTIGEKSVINASATYGYRPSTVSAAKEVYFDPETDAYISQASKNAILAQGYPVTVTCQAPDGTPGTSFSADILNRNEVQQTNVWEGSVCAISEGDVTLGSGIAQTTQIGVNAPPAGEFKANEQLKFVAGAGIDRVFLRNVFERQLTDVSLDSAVVLPGAMRQEYESSGGDLGQALGTQSFTIVCRDDKQSDEFFHATDAIQGEGNGTFTRVPVGAYCAITGDNIGSLHMNLGDPTSDGLTAHIHPKQADWAFGNSTTSDTELTDFKTTSPHVLTANDASSNTVRFERSFDYEMSPVALAKTVVGDEADLKLIDDETRFNFDLLCRTIGFQTTTIGTDDKVLPTSLKKADFDRSSQPWTYTSPEAMVPAGSTCEFRETEESDLADDLKVTAERDVVTGRAPAPGVAEATTLEFTNIVERRTSPVRIDLWQTGYLEGADSAGYTADVRCGERRFSTSTTFPLSGVRQELLPETDIAPSTGVLVDVPVGMDCTVDFDKSPALAPRGEVDVVDGDRRPSMRFAQWSNDSDSDTAKADGTEPGAAPQSKIGKLGKKYSLDFSIPGNAPSEKEVLIVGAEFYHPRALYDVTFTKHAEGGETNAQEFEFGQSCTATPETFTLKSGKTHTIKGVPVDSECSVYESKSSVENVNPVFDIASVGSQVSAVEQESPDASNSVTFIALPASGEDNSTHGKQWSVTAMNRFPGLEVTKRIPGTPLSAVTGGIANRAILPDGATSMEITYTVTNTGVFDATITQFAEPSLAGFSVRSETGSPVTIGDDGAIPAEICPSLGGTLTPKESVTCTINVDISDKPLDKNFNYLGTVAFTATSNGQEFVATDEYGATRLSGLIGALLPDTGMQTLVSLLVIGLLVFGYGAFRYLRRDPEDDAVEVGDNRETH